MAAFTYGFVTGGAVIGAVIWLAVAYGNLKERMGCD